MHYEKLDRADFDAIVTGELAHFAIWFDKLLEDIVCQYFLGFFSPRQDDFTNLILRRDGITFNTKIDIVAKIIDKDEYLIQHRDDLKDIFKTMDSLKRLRNAMAHGVDMGGEELELNIELTSSAGKKSLFKITPKTHIQNIELFQRQLDRAESIIKKYRDPDS
jgi:hypothetical protein